MTHRPRYRPHPDANQSEIVRGLRDLGYYVLDHSRTGQIYDLAVYGYDTQLQDHVWHLMEVKTEDGQLTMAQREFQDDHPGAVQVVRTLSDALAAFGRNGQ